MFRDFQIDSSNQNSAYDKFQFALLIYIFHAEACFAVVTLKYPCMSSRQGVQNRIIISKILYMI